MEHQNILRRSRYHPKTLWHTNALTILLIIKELQFTLLIKPFLGPRIHFFIICATIWYFLSETSQSILLHPPSPQPTHTRTNTPVLTSVMTPSSHRVSPPKFFPVTDQHQAGQSRHYTPTGFFHIWYSNAIIKFESSLHPQQFHH